MNARTTGRRTEMLTAAITQEEKRQLATRAQVAGVNVSEYVRRATLGDAGAASMTAGEYLSLVFRSTVGGDADAREVLSRAVADQATGDNLGVVPQPIVADILKLVDANRYVVNVARELPMPPRGATFTRPRTTQFTQVGAQATQHTELASRKMTIVSDTVTKATYGGVLDLSEQDIDWSDPAMLQIIMEDLATHYAVETEEAAATAVEAKVTTNNTDTSATATAAQFYTALGTAVASCYGTAKRLPDVLFAAVDRWQYLIGLTDTAGQPAGHLKVATPDGRETALRLVVSPAFTAGFIAVGCSSLVEYAEERKGPRTGPGPDTLSVRLAHRGHFSTNVYAQGLWGLVDVA